jgi:hypothetical protein
MFPSGIKGKNMWIFQYDKVELIKRDSKTVSTENKEKKVDALSKRALEIPYRVSQGLKMRKLNSYSLRSMRLRNTYIDPTRS